MTYKALYRTYRPNTFNAVAGQQHIITTLENAIVQNKLAHAYLFCGPRGTGKTSVAKLFAKAINCLNENEVICDECDNCLAIKQGNYADVIEIDAASNNGVDEIRNLIEKVKYAPLQGKYKVYIIDEVHMLSIGAFNALLKTLEEPPSHVVFILATTEPHKVIPTIISRCQRFDFTKVKESAIKEKIIEIINEEGIEYEDEAVTLISELADGGVRDALSILDQCISYSDGKITQQNVYDIYGIITVQEKYELLKLVFTKENRELLRRIEEISENGSDLRRLTNDLIVMLKEAVIYSYTTEPELLKQIDTNMAKEMLAHRSSADLLNMIDILMETYEQYRFAADVRSYFELCLLKLVNEQYLNQAEKVMAVETTEQPAPEKVEVTKEVIEDEVEKLEVIVEDVKETPQLSILQPESFNETQETKPKEISVTENTFETITDEYYLRLLVGANKETRTVFNEKWGIIQDYLHDINYASCAQKLNNSQVVAAGEDYILISVDYEARANDLNDAVNKPKIEEFIEETMDAVIQIFAIDKDHFKRVVELFRVRREANDLPEPLVIKAESLKETQEDSLNDRMEELFGPGMFQIK